MSFAVGSLVRARDREWVVLPDSTDDTLMVRPLGGSEAEATGIYLPLEKVVPAEFAPPVADHVGDHRSCRLLRDAIRLGFRSSAGPFRSFAGLAVSPRPYQLVPLLMALKQERVRLLVADDVGIGKTVEACLIAKELLERGEISRFAVLCPPHLAEQWQLELKTKFQIDATLVLSSTVSRLERSCAAGESVFERYPFVIISTDYIKSTSRRDEFLRTCPEFVIVDEAHTCAFGIAGKGGGRHHRYDLLKALANSEERHLVLVTATPHSGKEEAFRSLLMLLNPEFESLPSDLGGDHNRKHREKLASHLVQRRRPDIEHYIDVDTKFPKREELEKGYKLSPDYKKLFEAVLQYAREMTKDSSGNSYRQRVKWWSALALLRALASSPLAAKATLLTRSGDEDVVNIAVADERGRQTVLDMNDESESVDMNPVGDAEDLLDESKRDRARLQRFARQAEALAGAKDQKLQGLITELKKLLSDGYNPIIFCRFVATAEYLSEQLRGALPKKVQLLKVDGTMSPDERETVLTSVDPESFDSRVLVCTDCLSEGVNLQQYFDAVIHYDLAWNPTRHEQREGRVDRFGQQKPIVRVMNYYGLDNQIDGIILDILIRKQRSIRNSLGISIPVPIDTNQVLESIFEGLLLREDAGSAQGFLPGFEDLLKTKRKQVHEVWEVAAEREQKSLGLYKQQGIEADVVAAEVAKIREALGSVEDVKHFVNEALAAIGGRITPKRANGPEVFAVDLTECPRALKDLPGIKTKFEASFSYPAPDGVEYLSRTSPFVSALSQYVLEGALDAEQNAAARRSGAIRTKDVDTRTTLCLVRLRFQLVHTQGRKERRLLAEDCKIIGFSGAPSAPNWLSDAEVQRLLDSTPSRNVLPDQAREQVKRALDEIATLELDFGRIATDHGEALLESHVKVREAVTVRGDRKLTTNVEVKLPVDVMGVYVLLPEPKV